MSSVGHLELYSEPYTASGNIASDGILNQLGRPSLDPMTVLLREAVQNSWDARESDQGRIKFMLGVRTLAPDQLVLLSEWIFGERPPGVALFPDSEAAPYQVIDVFDSGTKGLGGPTRADLVQKGNEPSDFVDFLRNIGEVPDRKFTGGTYGYGRSVFYRISRARAICVFSRCAYKGSKESRFIASALGKKYVAGSSTYTGRHWWGRLDRGIAEPILGTHAEELALGLGMQVGMDGQLGTSILVLAPNLNGDGVEEAAQKASEIIPWYFWPKMIAPRGESQSPISFNVLCNGEQLEIADPAEDAPFSIFVEAYRLMQSTDEELYSRMKSRRLIKSLRPRRQLGVLGLVKSPRFHRSGKESGFEPPIGPSEPLHHVALMRKPELVVKYIAGPESSSDLFEYGGVFKADNNVDSIFASAEPPAHDDWSHQYLEDSEDRTFVRVALRRIREGLDEFASPAISRVAGRSVAPLGEFSNWMGRFFPGAVGESARVLPAGRSRPKARGQGGGRRERSLITIMDAPELVDLDGRPLVRVKFRVDHAEGAAGTLVKLKCAAVLDSGELEREPPLGKAEPKVFKWRNADDEEQAGTSELYIRSGNCTEWQAYIDPCDDIVTGIYISSSSVGREEEGSGNASS